MKRLGWMVVLTCLAVAPAVAQIPDEFINLKTLPKSIGKRELVSIMQQFAGALGVRCSHCHVGPDNLEGMDFASDELEPKRVARAMMEMTQQINDKLLPKTGRDELLRVRCVTCHRGLKRPEQLDDILTAALESGGVDAALSRYEELRAEHYGTGAYDFGPDTFAHLAETLAREKGDMDGAVRVTKRSLELHPDDGKTHVMLGQLHLQRGDKQAALMVLERALELDPGNEYARQLLRRVKPQE